MVCRPKCNGEGSRVVVACEGVENELAFTTGEIELLGSIGEDEGVCNTLTFFP